MNTRMPQNLTGVMATAWDDLFARADGDGVVTMPAEEASGLETLAGVGGCMIDAPAEDGSVKVHLVFADAPAEAVPTAAETIAAEKKTEYAAGAGRREESRHDE